MDVARRFGFLASFYGRYYYEGFDKYGPTFDSVDCTLLKFLILLKTMNIDTAKATRTESLPRAMQGVPK